MKKFKKKGFTLIELISVLVIMAILALIVIPLVMSIIRKARVSADKRSIDAYGRSIELAIAGYLLDTGKFPTEVSQLTIEYSGNEVECSTTQINPDSSVYLTGCSVDGRSAGDYKYGSDKSPTYNAYQVGDEVTYNGVDYYVIKDSSTKDSTVILLKAEPLSVAEVNQLGIGHVNRYRRSSIGTAYNRNGYGGIAYYTSETCGYTNENYIDTGCTTDYVQSEIKYVVDAWKNEQAPAATEARLISFEDLTEDLGFTLQQVDPTSQHYKYTENTPSWVYNSNYMYWTMSRYNDSILEVWYVSNDGLLLNQDVLDNSGYGIVVRPVIVLPKSAISS